MEDVWVPDLFEFLDLIVEFSKKLLIYLGVKQLLQCYWRRVPDAPVDHAEAPLCHDITKLHICKVEVWYRTNTASLQVLLAEPCSKFLKLLLQPLASPLLFLQLVPKF